MFSQELAEKIVTPIQYSSAELASSRVLSTIGQPPGSVSIKRQFITLDMQTGREVSLEDLVYFDRQETKPVEGDFYKVFQYRKRVFAGKIFELLCRLYPAHKKQRRYWSGSKLCCVILPIG